MNELWLQLTAGQGPAECAWALPQILEKLCEDAAEHGIDAKLIEIVPGPQAGTAQSALVALSSLVDLAAFTKSWRGTIQWTAKSPYRPAHKRKNWFVGIEVLEPPKETQFNLAELKWETMRASGPGGQHVNRTESAVRVTHVPTGTQATGSEERSQHRNRKLALARLAQKLADQQSQQRAKVGEQRWQAHQSLERGNPVRIFKFNE